MTDPIRITTERDGALERITLARPKANIVDAECVGAIRDHVARLADRRELKLLVFDAEGPHFSFGASIEEHLPEQIGPVLKGFHQMFRDIEALEVPTAALVRGQCLGGGFELATFCGTLFASPEARLGVPEVKLAVFPPVAAVVLPWKIGGPRATRLVIGGDSIDAATACDWGLVDQVVEDPAAALESWFETELEPKSAVALRYAYIAVRRGLAHALEEELPAVESLYLDQLMQHRDPVEGIRSFMEKRPAQWSHE